MRELRALLAQREECTQKWVRGKIPHHYKRLSIPMDRAIEYAKQGAAKIYSKFGDRLFFTQSLIAGAVLSDDFDEYVIVSPGSWETLVWRWHLTVCRFVLRAVLRN